MRCSKTRLRFAVLLLATLCLVARPADAHPVPRSNHDRTIVVRLDPDAQGGKVKVTVAYRLEVDELTVVLEDMVPFADEVEVARYRNKPEEFYAEFTRLYAPVLARNLVAAVDGKAVAFECKERTHRLRDEDGKLLGHLRCDFVFQAMLTLEAGKPHQFRLRESNYELQEGLVDLSLITAGSFRVFAKTEPDAALKKRSAVDLGPGDEDRLRQVAATFALSRSAEERQEKAVASAPPRDDAPATPVLPAAGAGASGDDESLLSLFLRSEEGFWLLMILAAGLGAAHALTPGHGKTLAAAYLVGANGTVWHALVLGLVTTFTHTAGVLVLALGLRLFYPQGMTADARADLQSGLGLAMGLVVTCFGIWLLLRRLSGGADHFHLPGLGHHHHRPGHHHHHHTPAPAEQAGWWGLILLGMSGGIIPCWDAIAMLVLAIGMNLMWLALPLLVAFSAGLAGVLILIGILVVRVRRFASSHWGEGRVVRSLPVSSALAVTFLGLWLCYDSIHRPRPGVLPARGVATSHP
jgi:ABC-type nickel/cobalt efflux system permease component RcnA